MLVQGYMAKLVEKVDQAPRGAGREFSKSLLNAMKERIPVDEAKEHAVFDIRFLEAEAAKKVLFRMSAVRRSMRIHARIFERFYKEFTTSKKVIAKALTTGHARLQQKAIFYEVYDIANVAKLEMRDEEGDISRMTIIMVDILQTFTIESAAAERGFSTLNRIRTKSRNRLSGENLSHCLSLKLNSLPQPEQVIGQWRKEMARRHRLSKPTSSSSSKTLSLQELEDALDSDYEPSSAAESEEDSDVEEQAKMVKSSAVARQRKKMAYLYARRENESDGEGSEAEYETDEEDDEGERPRKKARFD